MSKPVAVVVAGARTPFVKSFGPLMKHDGVALGVHAVKSLLQRHAPKLDPTKIDRLIWGNVVLQTNAPNMGREIVLDANLPRSIVAHMTSMACASGLNAVSQAANLVELGHAKCVVAGGSDSLSCGEVPLPRGLTHGLGSVFYNKRKGMGAFKEVVKHAGYPGGRWVPKMPSVAERSTGKTMGWHADVIAQHLKVARAAQEEFAAQSHAKAVAARGKGHFDGEIAPMGDVVADGLVREDVTAARLSSLKPVFRPKDPSATITAGTSSALTDGGSAVLVCDAAFAAANGLRADCRILAVEDAAIDPMPHLLLAPTRAIPAALRRAGVALEEIDVFEIHEAFAAQVLATIAALASPEYCSAHLGLSGGKVVGKIPMEKVNVNGGSLALGHPFAATGGRVVTAACNELRRLGRPSKALVSICAAGGLGSVAIIEHNPAGYAPKEAKPSPAAAARS